jgi:hypothetical protein
MKFRKVESAVHLFGRLSTYIHRIVIFPILLSNNMNLSVAVEEFIFRIM